MRPTFLIGLAAALASCTRTSDAPGPSKTQSSEDATTTDASDDGPGDRDADSGQGTTEVEAPEPFVPAASRFDAREFRLKEDSCGLDEVVAVESLMPESYRLDPGDEPGAFVLSSDEQRTETDCSAGPIDPETGWAVFSCAPFREGYRSPYGNGFDMEVDFSGELTEDEVLAGGLTVVIHCVAGSVCNDFAASGMVFPCTVGGDLILEPRAR